MLPYVILGIVLGLAGEFLVKTVVAAVKAGKLLNKWPDGKPVAPSKKGGGGGNGNGEPPQVI
jgi:H+/Cl- antiporter ClcA